MHEVPEWLKDHEFTMVGWAQALLTMLLGEAAAAEILDILEVTVITDTIDTNVLLQDLTKFILTGEPTGLMIAARFGGVRFFASTDVQDEVAEHLDRLTNRHDVELEKALQIWHTSYAPLITFLESGELEILTSRAASVHQVDPDDVATARVIDLIRSDIALSEDHSLAVYEAVGKEWRQVTVALRDKARRDGNFVVIHVGGGFSIWLSTVAVTKLVRLLLKLDRRILLAIAAAIFAGAALAVAIPRSRGWLKERAQQVSMLTSSELIDHVVNITHALISMESQATEARSFLADKHVVHEQPQQVIEYIREILSKSHWPLSPTEISRRMQQQGYEPKGEHPERYVARLLRQNPTLFEMQFQGKWGIKSHQRDRV